jgi:hypothetical protein
MLIQEAAEQTTEEDILLLLRQLHPVLGQVLTRLRANGT